MRQCQYKPLSGLRLGGLVLLITGLVLGVGFNEAAGTGVALVAHCICPG